MSAREEVVMYRAGEIGLSQLADLWAQRTWQAKEMPETVEEILGVEASPVPMEGTWDEVRELWATGQLSDEEYRQVSEAVDAAADQRAGG